MRVVLHIYDLSNGLAKTMSQSFLGKQIDGVWHTGVVCFGKEFFFGGGIQHDVPGRTPYGVPVERTDLGETHIPEDVFIEFLQEISSRFSMESYDLLHNNCNNFTNECSIFLTGEPIPEYITSLPGEVLNTPLGPMLEQMMKPGAAPGMMMPGGMPGGGGMPIGNMNMLGSSPAATPLAAATSSSSSRSAGGRGERDLHSSPDPAVHSSGAVGIAPPARSQRPHVHQELDASLPTLTSFNKPLLLQDKGDNGAAAMTRLRALLEAHHVDKDSPSVPPEEVEALNAIQDLLQLPVEEAQTHVLPKACHRFMARVLAQWPMASWGPALDLMRLLLLYPGVALHYAGTTSSHTTIVVKRCLAKSAASRDVPKGVKLRALFMVINTFAHACGVEKMMRPGAAADTIEAALDLINHDDASVRMSAAAILYNVSLYLPKEEGLEMVQISSGVQVRLVSEVDDETGFRLLLALGKLAYCNSSATQLFRTLNLNLDVKEWEGEETPQAKSRRAMAGELKVLLDAPLR